jgi:hypothetical protein
VEIPIAGSRPRIAQEVRDLIRKMSLENPLWGATKIEPVIGTTVHVEGPYLQRRTVNVSQEGAKKASFFGGSTMWGVGANDAGTIPSQFAALTKVHAENFAESGYIAHQSLVLLLQLLQAGHRPDLVVFLDGVNEVQAKCNTWRPPGRTSESFSSRQCCAGAPGPTDSPTTLPRSSPWPARSCGS